MRCVSCSCKSVDLHLTGNIWKIKLLMRPQNKMSEVFKVLLQSFGWNGSSFRPADRQFVTNNRIFNPRQFQGSEVWTDASW